MARERLVTSLGVHSVGLACFVDIAAATSANRIVHPHVTGAPIAGSMIRKMMSDVRG